MNKNVNAKKTENGKVESFKVLNVRNTDYGVFFTLILNGVRINDCKVVEWAGDDFISLPSKKGKDGTFYNTVWFSFSDSDTKAIIAEVEKQLQ